MKSRSAVLLVALLAVTTLAGAKGKNLTCALTVSFNGGAPPSPSERQLTIDESAGLAKFEPDIWSAHVEFTDTSATWTTFDFFADEFSMTLDRMTGVLRREEMGQGSTQWQCKTRS